MSKVSMIFEKRRQALMSQLDSDSVVVVIGNVGKSRSKNIQYHFRPDNDFYYLTGFKEPNAAMVLRPHHSNPYALFCRPNNAALETSFGARAGVNGAKEYFGADIAYAIEDFDSTLPTLLDDRKKVYFLDEQGLYENKIFSWLHQQRRATPFDSLKTYRSLLPLQPLIHNARRVKSVEEVLQIKKAVEASISAHKAVMKACKVGVNEGQLEAVFLREIANFGCKEVAYPSIVAGGNNACCLHYEDNSQILENGQMLLIDAGAEYQYYCSDITRSYPVNGKFSEEQKALYNIVLSAIDAAISLVKPGLSWHLIHQTCMEKLAKGLIDLGIISGSFDEVMKEERYLKYSVHKTGHWLGMDVHDVGSYHASSAKNQDDWLALEEHMVFTIEPGLYFPEDCLEVDSIWRGIGIRIEDDILVTKSGCENLSSAVPRTVEEIEMLMGW